MQFHSASRRSFGVWSQVSRGALALPLTLVMLACGAKDDVESGDTDADGDDAIFESALDSAFEAANDADVELGGDLTGLSNPGPGGLAPLCVSLTTDPADLNRNDLPASFTLNFTFDDCPIGRGLRQSGTRSMTHSRDLAALTRSISGTRDLERTMRVGDTVNIDASGTMTATGTRATGSVTRSYDYSEHRVRAKPSGDTVFDVSMAWQDVDVVDTFDTTRQLTRRVLSGAGNIAAARMEASYAITLTDITLEPGACCYPVSGSVTQTFSGPAGRTRERTYEFSASDDCGTVQLRDGRTLTLIACQ